MPTQLVTNENVILVDENNNQLGLMEKQEAHEKALLHRAFSVFIFNDKSELLLQQRANHKYHSAGLWTNTCCSHPRLGETNLQAANRRLLEEMGIITQLTERFSFIYKADVGEQLTEHELDFVFTGVYNQAPKINHQEVANYKWITLTQLQADILMHPNHYTTWFKIVLNQYLEKLT